MDAREYITSERFIWDELQVQGAALVDQVKQQWRKTRRCPRMLFAFPAKHVKTTDGREVGGVISFAIPDGLDSFTAAVKLAKATNAYALLLAERVDDHVVITLESHHGARRWKMKVAQHGDVEVLEKEEAATDTESIGVLWRPHTARS